MDPGWRLRQIEHNRRAHKKLAAGGDTRFWDWEAVIMFYGITIAVDGCAVMRGQPVPKNHKERRAVVRRHLPHLADLYDDLYTTSLEGRYYDGYSMTEKTWRKAARCYEALAGSIPVQ